jgi:hypothetical protein
MRKVNIFTRIAFYANRFPVILMEKSNNVPAGIKCGIRQAQFSELMIIV